MQKGIISRYYDKIDEFFAPFILSMKEYFASERKPERLILYKIVLMLVGLSLVFALVNDFSYHYQSLGLNSVLLSALPGTVFLLCVAGGLRCRWPRTSLLLTGTLLNLFFLIISGLLCATLIFTPFSSIDPFLLKVDYFFHFDTLQAMQVVAAHPMLHSVLRFAYDTWLPQIVLVPVILAVLNKEREHTKYLLALFFALLVGSLIYYCFPTAGPASVLHSPYFVEGQRGLAARFYDLHHYLPVTQIGEGLIAFPSFHVTYAILVVYTCRHNPILFYLMVALNALLVAATLLLGYHYVLDVLAGFVLAAVSIYWANRQVSRVASPPV